MRKIKKIKSVSELKIKLKSILDIYSNAKLFFQDTEYLFSPDTLEEKKIADNNFFIRRTRISAWRSTVLELCKLYHESNNENYNLIAFLEDLLSNYDNLEWKQKINRNKICEFIKEIKTPQIKSIRDDLKTLRDEEIAHTDEKNNLENKKAKVTFDEIGDILDLTERIIQESMNIYIEISQSFKIRGSEKAGGILNILNNDKKKRIKELLD